MKRIIALLSLVALLSCAYAQYIVYLPGAGERQFGVSLSPSYSPQYFDVSASAVGPDGMSHDLDVKGTISNNYGFNAGLFYGFETRHNRTIEFGGYLSAYYGINPFSGSVNIARDGETETHSVQYNAQRILLHYNPFFSFMINDRFSVSAGLGITMSPQIRSKVNVDGIVTESHTDSEGDIEMLLLGLFNFHFDVNAGVKYWFNEEWFCGLRLQYCFYSFSMLSLFGRSSDIDLSEYPSGIVDLDLDRGTALASYILPKSTAEAVISVGYVW